MKRVAASTAEPHRRSQRSLGTQRRFQHRAILINVFAKARSLQDVFLLELSKPKVSQLSLQLALVLREVRP